MGSCLLLVAIPILSIQQYIGQFQFQLKPRINLDITEIEITNTDCMKREIRNNFRYHERVAQQK